MTRSPRDLKALGYFTSILSVILLGAVAWNSAADKPLMLALLLAGMVTSVGGMGLRWLSWRQEQRRRRGG